MSFLAIFVFLFFSHGTAHRCVDVFSVGVSLAHFPRLQAHDVPYENSEISKHGTILSQTKQLEDFKESLLSRDGLYIFLLDRIGTIAIDHHLPLPMDPTKASFHGTHRGLLRQREQNFSHLGPPEIVFAGQLMVSAGKVVWVSDNSLYFYDAPKVSQQRGESDRDFRFRAQRDRRQLIQTAKARLRTVQNLLVSWGWIDASTPVKQTEESTGDLDGGARRWAHANSRQQALFERSCRAQQMCWDVVVGLQSQVTHLAVVNGLEWPAQRVQWLLRQDPSKAVVLIQWLLAIRDSGVVGVLSQNLNPQTGELKQPLQDFLTTLDWYEQLMLENQADTF